MLNRNLSNFRIHQKMAKIKTVRDQTKTDLMKQLADENSYLNYIQPKNSEINILIELDWKILKGDIIIISKKLMH
jgi:hypothetical protein